MEHKRINLGCGNYKKEGFLNVDISPKCNPDMIVDLEKPLPFSDNVFEHIYSSHTLEHIRPQYFKQLLNEIQRVAKNGCILELILPFDNHRNRTCTDHYRTFGWMSFYEYLIDEEKSEDRSYFGKLKLKRIGKIPNKFVRLWQQWVIHPFYNEICLKFEVVK